MTESDQWTIGRLLTWTTDYLKQHGSDSPRLDAEVLLAVARNCKRIELYTAFDEIASEEVRTAFRELVHRRAEGAPVAYLVGKREFYSLPFRVTPDVLIPRAETELLAMRVIDLVKEGIVSLSSGEKGQGGGEVRIADVGVGSGIIAVVTAKHLPQAQITAIDSSPAALSVARQNASHHGVAGQIEFVESDLFAAVDPARKFAIIASNPPYVAEAEFDKLAPTVRNFEPRAALVAGPLGTEVIERLVPEAAQRLEPSGWLLIEVSPMIEPAVRDIIARHGSFELAPTIKDPANHPRIVQAKRIAP